MAPTESGYSVTPRELGAAGRTMSGDLRVTSENAKSVMRRFKVDVDANKVLAISIS